MKIKLLPRILLALIFLAVIVTGFLYREELEVVRLQQWIEQAGLLAPLLFMALYALFTVAFLPGIIMTLAEQGKVVLYEQPLPIEVGDGVGGQRHIIDEVARLHGLGKIDIQVDIDVDFEGDTRVLRDITTLARKGYGEDNFGNNIALPKELAYLKR